MIRLSRERVLLLHQLLIDETGGAAEVRDLGLLDSAADGSMKYDALLQWVREHRL